MRIPDFVSWIIVGGLAFVIAAMMALMVISLSKSPTLGQSDPTPRKIVEIDGITVWYVMPNEWPHNHVYFTTPGGHISVD